MAVTGTIKDGQGTDVEARVSSIPAKDQSNNCVYVVIGGVAPGFSLPTQVGITGQRFEESITLNAAGVTKNANVDGSVTPQEFKLEPDATFDIIVSSISMFGADGSIKMANFLGINSGLTNGCVLAQKADNNAFTYDTIKTTNDFIKRGTEPVDFVSQASGDSFKVTIFFEPAIPIRRSGTFGPASGDDDYITFTVNDNLTSVVELEVIVKGNLVEAGTL